MTKNDYIKEQIKECQERWFKEHLATRIYSSEDGPKIPAIYPTPPSIWVYSWRDPKSWNYGMHFSIYRGWLTVVGDIGEAVYEWGQGITPVFLAGVDFHYFRGKCQASEQGREFNDYHEEVGMAGLREFVKDTYTDQGKEPPEVLIDVIKSEEFPIQDDWRDIVHSLYEDEGDIVDTEVLCHLMKLPEVPAARQIGHFVGVQMAIKALNV